MRSVPPELVAGPFTRQRARALGVTDRMLDGERFVRLLPRVFRRRDHRMTWGDWISAAELAMPGHARVTGITRIQRAGLDFGPRWPVRLVVQGDLHLAHPLLFLHRTKRLPPTDELGVVPAAAYIAYCRRARVVDAIKVGDWLLHHGHMTVRELHDLALGEQWRDGADEALWILGHLDGRARSLAESETRAVLDFACLPRPEVNRSLPIDDDVHLIGDLVFTQWRTVVEYEGRQHQEERACYVSDIDRYAVMRRHGVGYVQVTYEKLARPQSLVGEVYRELMSRGYDGEPPRFGVEWRSLFLRVSDVLGPRRHRRDGGGWSTVS